MGTVVVVGGLDISWFLRLDITDLSILDKRNATILSFHRFGVNVKNISFKKHRIDIQKALLEESTINLVYSKSDGKLNAQFLIDYFSSNDSVKSASTPWDLKVRSIQIRNSNFAYRDERYMSPGKGIDYSDLSLSELNLELNDLGFSGDSIFARISSLSAREKSGFFLKHLEANALVSPRGLSADSLQIITNTSSLGMDLSMRYSCWNAFNDFIDSVRLEAEIRSSVLDMQDITSFAPETSGMNDVFSISGRIAGTVSSFSGKQMLIGFGAGTLFKGAIRMTGLPYIEETFVHLKIDEFRSNAGDVESFTLPGSDRGQHINLPEEATRLGSIIIKGKFTGFYNDFVSNATFLTDAGNIATDILLTNNRKEKIIEYNGRIQASEFDLGKVFNLNQIGAFSMDAEISGKGFLASNADLTVNGNISNFQLMGNNLNSIQVDGNFKNKKFDGVLNLRDQLANLDFNGSVDFSDSLPAFDFKAVLENALLTRLHLWDRDSTSCLSTHMNLNFKGNTLDNLLGSLIFEKTSYYEAGKLLNMKEMKLQTSQLQGTQKKMVLSSDFADAVFSGSYTFDDLSEYLTFVFTDYLPGLALVSPQNQRTQKGSFDYTVQLKNTKPLTSIFVPSLQVDPNTVVSGGFDPVAGLVNVNGRSPLIILNGMSFHDWMLRGSSLDQQLNLVMNCSSVDMSGKSKPEPTDARIEQLSLNSVAKDDSVKFKISWNDFDTADYNKASLGGVISFSEYPILEITIDSSQLLVNDTVWSIAAGSHISIDSASFEISKFRIESQNQAITANGTISTDPLDQLEFDFKDFNISQFDLITAGWGIDFDGKLNGKLSLADLYNIPLIRASLIVDDLGFNHELLGDAEINSTWDNQDKAIDLDTRIVYHGTAGLHYPIKARGSIFMDRLHDNFDLLVSVDNVKIKTLQPFFTGLFSRMKGWASGELTLTGDFADPIIKGSAKLMRSEMMIDYLRATYSFTGDFNFDKDLMWFKDIKLADSLGNTGVANGNIHHKAFDDWNLDIDVVSNGLSVLNTTFSQEEMYYGRARAMGTMKLTGPIDDLVLDVKAKSAKGTEVFIPINYAVNISDNDYIRYVVKDQSPGDSYTPPTAPSNLNLKLGLDVTRDAGIEIILPYRMGNIKVKGDGLIDMGIDTRGEYTMHGQYVMDKGSFLFNLQDIFSRTFEIRKGSTITFNGSPYDADINLQAVYKIKTNLNGLSSVPPELASRRVPVDCIISLNNSLYNPDIHFSISMPEADAEMQRLVYGAIDTANTVAMNQQMISLLVLNSFTSASENTGINTSGIGISSFGFLSGQLNNWLSQISKDFDIGVNYRPGDQMTAQELELALSTQLFNDRVVIDGTFGMSSTTAAASNANSNQWIGDVNVEVKITEDGRFRVKAFNRTNTALDLYTGQSPYTQGVGILYRKEFDNLRELFHRQRKAKVVK